MRKFFDDVIKRAMRHDNAWACLIGLFHHSALNISAKFPHPETQHKLLTSSGACPVGDAMEMRNFKQQTLLHHSFKI